MSSEVALDLNEAFDGNNDSCISTMNLLGAKDLYSGNIRFSQYKQHNGPEQHRTQSRVQWTSNLCTEKGKLMSLFLRKFFRGH